ncbi:protein-disulfide reductase DsbD [Nitrosophilus alvini]|uniref:protein-disulfide reductase DsbD n=1 Tax=Nitrosophilus alvini TaxID=2714855 RepID=UPI001909DDBF|nr:protein-disulfide reductase DsbD [Nitrosophilus alvini]
MKKLYGLLFILTLSFVYAFDLEQKILEPEEAFKPSATVINDKVVVNIKLGEKIYLYQDQIKAQIVKPEKKELKISLPAPEEIHGDKVYFKELRFEIPKSEIGYDSFTLKVSFQGCSEAGLCYTPMSKEFELSFKQAEAKSKPQNEKNTVSSTSEQDKIADTLRNESVLVILATFFGFGLLLALTPCLFPMIPILSSIIVGTKNITAKKAFFLSVVYVLAMSVTYTVAGVLAGLFGSNLQTAFQDPIIIVVFSLVFVALAFSMFGFYEIQLPASLQTKLAKKSEEAGGHGVIGVAIMGFLSALIVGPCVAPPLAGALIYIGQTGDAVLGGAALFMLSIGMGLPLILIGTGAGKFMPKPGPWMTAVTKVFGVVMLGVAVWMLSRIVPDWITLLLWAVLFIGSAVYMRSFEALPQDGHWFHTFKKAAGIIMFIYGVFLFIGSFTGANNPLDPLKSFKPAAKAAVSKASKTEMFKKVSTLEELMNIVKNSDKPVMVDFYADWCVSCKELEHNTFSDERVRKELENFITLQVDVTKNSEEDKKLLKYFNLFGPPAILFFENGKEVKGHRVIGYKGPEEFLDILRKVNGK